MPYGLMKLPPVLRFWKSHLFATSLIVAGSAIMVPARAQTWMSTTYKAGELWSDGTKWVGGVAPANDGTANVVFSGSNATNIAYLDANWNVDSVYFNSTSGLGAGSNSNPASGDAYGVTPTLTIQQGGITNASTYAITINPALALAQPQTWNVGTGGALVVYNVSGAGTLNKTGAEKLSLASAQNAFTGSITVGGGTVVATNGPGLGPDGSPVTVQNSATLSFSSSIN